MKKFLITLSILVALFSTPSFSKTFISGLIGYAWINSEHYDENDKVIDAHQGPVIQFYLGYLFPVNDTFSVGPEIGLVTNIFIPGDNDQNQKLLISSSIPVDIKAKININPNFYFFGRAGMALVRQVITNSWVFPIGAYSKWQPTFGGGFGYNINKSLSLELAYNFTNGNKGITYDEANTSRFQNVSLGVTYSF